MAHKRSRDERDEQTQRQHQHQQASKLQKTYHNTSASSPFNTNGHNSHNPCPSTKPSLAALNVKFPDTQHPYPTVSSYKSTNPLALRANLPALPPLLPGPLSTSPFTHASVSDAKYGTLTYERLEFLGDAYLEVIATRLIFSRFPKLAAGRQSKLRERLVRNSTLAEFARTYNFRERIQFAGAGEGEREAASAKAWEKIEADMFEAYIAAVILSWPEDGFAKAEEWLTALWTDILLNESPDLVENRKDELARLVGGKEVKIEYLEEKPVDLVKKSGEYRYTMAVYLTGWGYEKLKLGSATGLGMKEAGMKAVLDAFERNRELIDQIAKTKREADEARRANMAAVKE